MDGPHVNAKNSESSMIMKPWDGVIRKTAWNHDLACLLLACCLLLLLSCCTLLAARTSVASHTVFHACAMATGRVLRMDTQGIGYSFVHPLHLANKPSILHHNA